MVNFGPTVVAVVAAGVALLVGTVIIYLARKRMGETDTNDHSTKDRQDHRERVNAHLSSRQKWRLLSGPAKLAYASFLVAFGVVVYEVYTYFKTGSPHQVIYSTYSVVAVASTVGGVLGLKYGRGRMRSEGYLEIEYEATPDNDRTENSTKIIPFDPDDTFEDEDGLIVHEQTDRRVFGLWRRARTIIEHKQLRKQSLHRPDEDKIAHLVPDRAVETRPNHFYFRTKGERIVKDPDEVEDVTYLPSYSMSNEEKMQFQADMDMIVTENKQLRTRLASAHKQLDALEDEVHMLTEQSEQETFDKIERLAEILGNGQNHYNYAQMQAANGHSGQQRNGQSKNSGGNRVDRAIAVLNGEEDE